MIDWISEIESRVYSRIKHNIQGKVRAKFPSARFTTSSQSNSASTLPCIFIHEIELSENARTLEGDSIEAILYPMEVKITANTEREDVKWMMSLVIEEFKKLGFAMSMLTPVLTDANTYYRIARFRRAIGMADKF